MSCAYIISLAEGILTMKTALTLSLLICGIAHAETENFDMTLSGDFEKDYCTISFFSHENNDIDLTSTPPPMIFAGKVKQANSERGPELVGRTIYTFTCANGQYNIIPSTTDPSPLQYPAQNIAFTPTLWLLDQVGGIPLDDSIELSASQSTSIFYDTDSLPSAAFEILVWAEPMDSVWENVGDSFSHTFTHVFTIEHVN